MVTTLLYMVDTTLQAKVRKHCLAAPINNHSNHQGISIAVMWHMYHIIVDHADTELHASSSISSS
eukprot:157420-Ditylum_brightwellii.AAC.1